MSGAFPISSPVQVTNDGIVTFEFFDTTKGDSWKFETDGTNNFQLGTTTNPTFLTLKETDGELNFEGTTKAKNIVLSSQASNPSPGEGSKNLWYDNTKSKILSDEKVLGPELYDAVVDAGGTGDFTLISAAIAAGHNKLFIRSGTYLETADIDIPDNGILLGEVMGEVVIDLQNTHSVKIDGSGGIQEMAGTISVTNGGVLVVGVGTSFTNLSSGDQIFIDNVFYKIASIADNTNLDISTTYYGKTISGADYFAQTMYFGINVSNLIIKNSIADGLFIRAALDSTFNNLCIIDCSPNIRLENNDKGSFHNVYALNSRSNGVEILHNFNLGLLGCKVCNNNGHGMVFETDGVLMESKNANILNCIVSNNDGSGIVLESTSSTEFLIDITLSGSFINNNKVSGVTIASDNREIEISKSYIKDNGSDGVVNNASITMVDGSYICGNGGIGLNMFGDENIINSNFIRDNTSDGCKINAGALDNIITSCNLRGNSGINLNLIEVPTTINANNKI